MTDFVCNLEEKKRIKIVLPLWLAELVAPICELYYNIFKLRKDLKLSQEQLAEKVDVTRQTISNWELGETSPNPEQLKLLSKTLNVSIDELLNYLIEEPYEKKNESYKILAIKG